MSASRETEQMSQRRANPDDPQVRRASQGPHGPLPVPYSQGLLGRAAIVQGQLCIVAVVVVVQIWLIPDALYELLSGRSGRGIGPFLVKAQQYQPFCSSFYAQKKERNRQINSSFTKIEPDPTTQHYYSGQ
jgi:hypothetical protein